MQTGVIRMKWKSLSSVCSDDEMLYQSIKNARSELDWAVSVFNELTDNAAIDYASYYVLAARTKYSYLLQQAKERDLSI